MIYDQKLEDLGVATQRTAKAMVNLNDIQYFNQTFIEDAFSFSGGHPLIPSQYAIYVFKLSTVGCLPYVPVSPWVHLFKNWEVDFEPSYFKRVDFLEV